MSAHPLRSGDLVRIRGETWRVVRLVCHASHLSHLSSTSHPGHGGAAVVDVEGCDVTNRATQARFLLPFEPIDRADEPAAPRLVRPRRWRHVVRRLLADAAPSWASLAAATRANLTLIPFQLEPAMALARGAACRFLIADEVGLGKTVQGGLMIAEVLERRPDARALVVAPAALREQWRDELRIRFGLEADVLNAAGMARLAARLPAGVNPWSVQPVGITSIDYVKRPEVMRSLEALAWDLVVFDEAHHLAGPSDRAFAATAIGNRARALVLLTATPHTGEDEAFGRLCNIGNLNGAHPLLVFRRTRADVGIAASRRTTLLRVRPTPEEAAMHAALTSYARRAWHQSNAAGAAGVAGAAAGAAAGARLAMSVLARRACSSAASLARSVERRIALLSDTAGLVPGAAVQIDLPFADAAVDDEEPDAWLRSPGLSDAGEERARLHELLDLARVAAAAESKLTVLRRLLSRTTEPAIVFTEYRDTLRRVATAIEDVETVQLHGGLTPRERADAMRRFTEGGARLLLATDAASEGLNLHHRCRLVVNLELPWTPLRLDQRAGRVDRIGQARRVHALHLVAAGTCEESTLARLVRRINRIREAIGQCGPLPGQQRVAESALGSQPLPDLEEAPPAAIDGIVEGTIAADLRREACEEAERLARARAWLDESGNSNAGNRAVITRLRRCDGGPADRQVVRPRRQLFWAFRMTVTNASGLVIWESLLPLAASLATAPGPSRADIRSVLNHHHPAIEDAIRAAQAGTLRTLRDALRQPLHLWTSRERDLMATMRDRYARLSAGLLQGALFDRRHERLASAQAALLDEALSRSALRLDELAASEDVRADASHLAFAVVLE